MELFFAFFILLGILMVIAGFIEIAGSRINRQHTPPADAHPRNDTRSGINAG